MLAVIHGIGEVAYPVAEYHHSRLLRQLQVKLYVAVAEQEVVNVGVVLDVLAGEQHEVLPALSHIGRFLAAFALHAAVPGPLQAEPYAPTGVKGREKVLTQTAVEHGANHLELRVGVAETVAVGKEEHLSVDFGGERLLVQHYSALALQIVVSPNVVVAREVVHLNPHVGKLRQFAEKARIALRHHVFVLIPEVEHVAQQIDCRSLVLYAVEKAHQPALLHAPVFYGQ